MQRFPVTHLNVHSNIAPILLQFSLARGYFLKLFDYLGIQITPKTEVDDALHSSGLLSRFSRAPSTSSSLQNGSDGKKKGAKCF